MKFNTLLPVTAALFFLPAINQAQVVKYLNMDDAIKMGLESSHQLQASRAKLSQAQAAYREAKERRLPDFKISGSYLRLLNTDIDLKIKSGSNTNSGGSSSEQPSQAGAMPSPDEAAYAMANISLPLFAGLKIQSGVESAKYLQSASQMDEQKDQSDVIQRIVSAYNNLYKASAGVALVAENLRQAEARVKDLSNLEQNGLLARNDLLKAQLQKSNVALALLDAQSNYRLANQQMNLLLGLPEETLLRTDTVFQTLEAQHTLNEWESIALVKREDAAALGYRVKAAAAGIKYAKSDYYPSLALTGGYIGAYVPNILTINDAINAGIGLSYSPSSLWKTGAKVVQAKARLSEIEANQAQLLDAIRLQVAQAFEQYQLCKEKIEVYALAVTQSEENYRIVNNKYHNSLATTTDLLDADIAQLQAKLNYAFAKADANGAYVKLQQTTGTLTAPQD
ncbi:MAG: TolC family protein [Bacteroidetes bacterium]|nr:TolC family protein [Bacteroidota bacterium]